MSAQGGQKSYPVAVPQYAPQQQIIDPRIAMRGLAPGGQYVRENYCGVLTTCVAVFLCPCVCFCPFDTHEVYIEPGTGRRAVLSD